MHTPWCGEGQPQLHPWTWPKWRSQLFKHGGARGNSLMVNNESYKYIQRCCLCSNSHRNRKSEECGAWAGYDLLCPMCSKTFQGEWELTSAKISSREVWGVSLTSKERDRNLSLGLTFKFPVRNRLWLTANCWTSSRKGFTRLLKGCGESKTRPRLYIDQIDQLALRAHIRKNWSQIWNYRNQSY